MERKHYILIAIAVIVVVIIVYNNMYLRRILKIDKYVDPSDSDKNKVEFSGVSGNLHKLKGLKGKNVEAFKKAYNEYIKFAYEKNKTTKCKPMKVDAYFSKKDEEKLKRLVKELDSKYKDFKHLDPFTGLAISLNLGLWGSEKTKEAFPSEKTPAIALPFDERNNTFTLLAKNNLYP